MTTALSTPSTPADVRALPARARGPWREASVLLLLAIAGLMLASFRDYGLTADEGVQHRYGRKVLRWYAGLGQDELAAQGDIAMYGGFFELVAEAAAAVSPLDTYETRHLVNVVFAFVAFVAALRIGSHLAGPAGGCLSLAFLALTPIFYGHSFNNPKDIPFAAMVALAAWQALRTSATARWGSWQGAVTTGIAVGLAAGVRAAGIGLFGAVLALWAGVMLASRSPREHAPRRLASDIAGLAASFALMVAVGWTVMLLFWPWALDDPLGNPLRAGRAFSHFWSSMTVLYDGRLLLSGEVSRFYLPRWFSLVLPESYAIAFLLGALALLRIVRRRPRGTWPAVARVKAAQAGWLAALATLPLVVVVVARTPLYDGPRHFLFVVPLLAVLAGTSAAAYLREYRWSVAKAGAVAALGGSGLVTAVDMVELHPYQTVYFNRAVAGGLPNAITRWEGDYWGLSYKEGAEWLVRRYDGVRCHDRIRVATNSVFLQTAYYLRKTEAARRLFKPVGMNGRPHFVLATTRYRDHVHTPGRLAHVVQRQGAGLLYVFEMGQPPCEGPYS